MLSQASRASAPSEPASLGEVAEAIALTVAYSDLFDHCLSIAEVSRLLIGLPASQRRVREALAGGHAADWVAGEGELCYLHDRRLLLGRRKACEAAARELWRAARRYLRIVEAFPFVRMVAVTGALAMNNVEPDDDVDLFVVAAPGRLWLCRGFLVALARLSRRVGPPLCPNFLVTTRRLAIPDRNLFTAHELFQMMPVSGYAVYGQMLAQNAWAQTYLPNAGARPAPADGRRGCPARPIGSTLEALLGSGLGRRLEAWEMGRKIGKLRPRDGAASPTVDFGPDCCRGHFEDYDRRTLEAFAQRRRLLGLAERPGITVGGAG